MNIWQFIDKHPAMTVFLAFVLIVLAGIIMDGLANAAWNIRVRRPALDDSKVPPTKKS